MVRPEEVPQMRALGGGTPRSASPRGIFLRTVLPGVFIGKCEAGAEKGLKRAAEPAAGQRRRPTCAGAAYRPGDRRAACRPWLAIHLGATLRGRCLLGPRCRGGADALAGLVAVQSFSIAWEVGA